MNIQIPEGYNARLQCKYKPFADEPAQTENYAALELGFNCGERLSSGYSGKFTTTILDEIMK